MKTIMINRRVGAFGDNDGGWAKEKTENSDSEHCDFCGQRLWIAPDNETIYCNTDYCGKEALSVIK